MTRTELKTALIAVGKISEMTAEEDLNQIDIELDRRTAGAILLGDWLVTKVDIHYDLRRL